MDNPRIIHAPMNGRRFATTSPITQYDYGYLLLPEGMELPATYEIDFSNDKEKGTSLPVYGGAEGAEVPEELIRTGKDIYAFYYRVGDGYGKTEFTWRIPNKCRPSRDGETPTPSQQSSIDQLIVRSNEAVESAEQSASEASTSAQESAESARASANSAVQASLSESNAERAKGNAQASAESASASATASAQSASQSAQIKSDVEGMMDDAQGYVESASQSASASAQSASDAHGYANSASASAQSASGYASQAQTSAQTASAKASEASQSATTASQKATESAQSASQALTYKTDAESAKTASQTAQGLAESARDNAIQAKEDAESARDEAQSLVDGISGKVEQIDSNTERIESLEDDRYKPYVTDSASGSIASFPDGADGIPLKNLVVSIDPVQDLSNGDPSPENICPISGWTGMNVVQSGVNVWDEEWETGAFDANGQKISGMNAIRSKNYIPVLPNTTYYYKNGSNISVSPFEYDANKTFLKRTGYILNQTFTTGENTHYLMIGFPTAYGTAYKNDTCINYPSTDHDYHPYTGRSITINLGQTVYGGHIDVLSGVLTVDRANIASYNGETLPSTWISDRDEYASGTTPTTGAQVVYQLATPLTIQLDAHAVSSLYGVNNIWADSGDTEVEYRADTKLYIEKLTQPEEDDMIADANITSGQYFMVGNNLFKATANIANGSAIVVGTNCIRKSLSEALNEINA